MLQGQTYMITDHFTQSATIKRLGSATKTKRTYATSGSGVLVSEPQIVSERNLLDGSYGQYYAIYSAVGSDILQGDQLTVGGVMYTVFEVMKYKYRNLEFIKVKAEKS